MELLNEPWMLVSLVALGVLIGGLTGVFGIGGAFIATPVMISVLGIEPTMAIGCSMGYTLFNGILGGFHHFRAGNKPNITSVAVAFGAAAGIGFGFYLHLYFEEIFRGKDFQTLINLLFLVLLIPIGLLVWRQDSKSQKVDLKKPKIIHRIKIPPMYRIDANKQISMIVLFAIGAVIGILKGLIGIGGGVILVPVLVMFVGLSPHKAVSTSLSLVIVSSAIGLLLYAWKGQVDLVIVAATLLGSLLGVRLGTKLCHAVNGRRLIKLFAILIFSFSGLLLIDIVFDFFVA